MRTIFRIVNFIEMVPYYIGFCLWAAWWYMTLPFKQLKIEWDFRRTMKRIRQEVRASHYYTEGE